MVDGLSVSPPDLTVALTDNDIAYTLTALTNAVIEGDVGSTILDTFSVSRTGAYSQASQVGLVFSGTATEGEDYGNVTPVAGTVIFSATISFDAGETTQLVRLDVFGDEFVEPDETLIATLVNPTGTNSTGTATIDGSPASVTIVNDDQAALGLIVENSGPTVLGQTTLFTATLVTGTNVIYTWDFGDSGTGSGSSTNHIYQAYGPHTATVTARTVNNLLTATTVVTIIVDPNGNVDSDGDTILDRYEDVDGDGDPTNDDADNDGIPNYRDQDSDGDGILDEVENASFTGNPFDQDNDGDGIPDFIDPDSNPATLTPRLHLALIAKNYAPAPDLVVTDLIVASNSITVELQNQGDRPLTASMGFWVDLYVNPDSAPTQVNDVWHDGRSTEGIVWGIHGPILSQLYPGGKITLHLNDDYMVGSTLFSGIDLNDVIVIQTDSANADSTYGGVLEKHEIVSGAYNNIFQKTITHPSETVSVSTINIPTQDISGLPVRVRLDEGNQ
ncbi:MAG: PKD domain-containing protein [Chloroflexota bacterium]